MSDLPEIPESAKGNVYTIALIGGEPGETGTLWLTSPEDLCEIYFHYRGKTIEAAAEDFFAAFCRIRLQLEAEGLLPFCFGASLNVFPSAMSRSMGGGLKAYKLTMGQSGRLKDLVEIFDSNGDVEPASVTRQRKFFDDWLKSLAGR